MGAAVEVVAVEPTPRRLLGKEDAKNAKNALLRRFLLRWRWRELNPRPEKVLMRFLHAYPSL
jgi:hypothetical protein